MEITIWDTAGHERYDPVTEMYCRGVHAAIVVYDITRENSFFKARYWFERLQHLASPNIFKALVGNKADLFARDVEYKVMCVTLKLCRFTLGIRSAVLLENLILVIFLLAIPLFIICRHCLAST